AVVSHGGAGAMLGAAAHGLPHLVLPQAADHFRNARALSRVSAGSSVDLERQSVEAVSTELSKLLADGAMSVGATLLAREMAAMHDAAAAARMLERWHSCTPLVSG
ncbi:MAG: glycosyltransferase, partial [Burkholderiaceae bacterium]